MWHVGAHEQWDSSRRRAGSVTLTALTLGVLTRATGVAQGAVLPSFHATPHTAMSSISQIVNHPVASRGCGCPPPVTSGRSGHLSLSSAGVRRMYRVHVPAHYRPSHSYPLVLSFHGNGSDAVEQEARTRFSVLADQTGFVVIYPQGTVGPNGRLGWSSGGRGHPTRNDTLFVSDLLTTAQARLCIDPTRIYATGFSNGGGMTALLACRLAGRIAAFASVSGSYYPVAGGCAPGRPVALLEIHGTGDHVVPYAGNADVHLLATPM